MQITTFITIYTVMSQMTFLSRNTRFSRHFWVCYQALNTFNDVWPCCPLPEDSKDQEHFDKSNKQKTELQHKKEEAPCKKKFEGLVDSKPGRKRERGDVTESGKAKKEKVEPGLMYLLANLTTEMMKKGGVQTKEEAEQLVNQDILNNHSCFKVCVQYSEAWAECQSPH